MKGSSLITSEFVRIDIVKLSLIDYVRLLLPMLKILPLLSENLSISSVTIKSSFVKFSM